MEQHCYLVHSVEYLWCISQGYSEERVSIPGFVVVVLVICLFGLFVVGLFVCFAEFANYPVQDFFKVGFFRTQLPEIKVKELHALHSDVSLLEIQSVMTINQHIAFYCLILGLGSIMKVRIAIQIIAQVDTVSIKLIFYQNFHCSRPV